MTPDPALPSFGMVYNTDCLPLLKSWKDASVDLVITDPPYGMEYVSNHREQTFKPIVGDARFPKETLAECLRVARCAVFCFMRWENLVEVPRPKSFIVWAKNNWTGGDLEHEYARQWEGCAFWPKDGHEFIGRPTDIIDCRRIPPKDHPTEKPTALLEAIIRHNRGATILDPYAGVGSTLVAAASLGRKWVGVEIDPGYAKIAQDRACAEVNQGKLFPVVP